MESKFTPAPWYPIDICGWQHIHSEPYYDAIDLLNDEECEEAKHNVKVACAAPDLLEACQQLMASYDKNQHLLNFDVNIIREAIHKALL